MANTFQTSSVIAREALMHLRNNCVMARLVHRDYAREFVPGRGTTVTVRKPASFTAEEHNGTTVTTADATEGSVAVTLDHLFTVTFGVTSQQWALSLVDFSEQLIKPAAIAIAQAIDSHITALYAKLGRSFGVAGTTPDTLDDIWGIAAELDKNMVPVGQRRLVLDPTAASKLGPAIALAQAARSDGQAKDALGERFMGRIGGFDCYMDQNIAYHTLAGVGTVLIKNAGTAYGVGDTAIVCDGITTALAAGDLISLAHGGSVGTVTYAVASVSSLVGDVQTLTLAEGLKAAAGAANDNAVTLIASHRANMAFHKNALAAVIRPLEKPKGAASAEYVDFDGFGLRVVFDYNMQTKSDLISVDVLCGFANLYPNLGGRLLG